ncbi:hypothetical protein [Hymenobacter norwichensis]|uniref:hypothetical protein n=1 Tax=Hymenobacter norwichensis TaxID=223903 RepID=UPI0003B4D05C|nr:hypothetical protein [Hymenobacter norwichensis]
MKIVFAFAAALALSVTASFAQTTTPGSTPTVNGNTSPQSAPPAQGSGSLGTLPASNTQPASDMPAQTTAGSARRSGKMKGNKDMDKARTKKTKMKSSTTTTSPQ